MVDCDFSNFKFILSDYAISGSIPAWIFVAATTVLRIHRLQMTLFLTWCLNTGKMNTLQAGKDSFWVCQRTELLVMWW